MYRVAVFAGLGSESLFSRTTLDTAVQDASLPESQIILRACHATFRTQIEKAIEQCLLSPELVSLDDFDQPESLIQPPLIYHHNVVIQHTAIYLIQIFRFLRHSRGSHDVQGAAGFCAGLLPAAVVATSHNVIEFMQRAQEFFHVTLWLGINSESYRRTEVSRSGCSPNLPWSVVVHNISHDIITELLSDTEVPIYVSARNSLGCVTLSGKGDQLAQFIDEKLPSQCRTRPTNVFSLYHNRDKLSEVFHQTVGILGQEISSQWKLPIVLAVPLFSTVTGEALSISANLEASTTLGELVSLLLEMIFLEPVDWVSVQESILSDIQHHVDSEKCEILNFGPGYGVSKPAQQLPQTVEIRDVSATGVSSTPGEGASNISLDDIAIVGMAVDLPGASDADELWDNLCNGVNSCSEIPSSRFHIDDFYQKKDEKGSRAKRSINTRYGNFLKNPFLFDNDLFDISPREAKSIDPQQRVLLQTSYRALEDAGYVPDSTPSFARDTFGCFVGNATLDYTENLRADIDVYYSPGTLRAFQSGRISYYFGWSGPSITLDTACSSSMVALHQAVRALTAGDCRAALVGGVNVITSPDMYLGLDRAHFLSPTGQCKAFDASADGYCRSEGCGIFIVKKMRDALAEGDRIHAVIKGIELNQSGNAHSITHPHSPTQEQLFRQLLGKTKIHPHQLSVVETHGTGTQAGDPNELESLRSALCSGRSPRNPVHFTSIKANLGHAEAASGAAALAKVILMMRHGKIPPLVSLKNLNPKIQKLDVDGSVIDREVTTWRQPEGQPRLALINNFGAAGSNAAVIVREYEVPTVPRHTLSGDAQTYVLGLSSKSTKVLNKLREELIAELTRTLPTGSPSLGDICYTMTARRQLYGHRISVTADSVDKLIKALQSAQPSHVPLAKASGLRIAFVFSGQGSQYLGMGQQLMSIYPVFSRTIRQCDQILKRNGFPGCLEIIDPSTVANTNLEDNNSQIQAFQSAIYALEVALAQLLISWNILPSLVVGHSLGEYAALVTAGVLDISSGALLVARRAQLMVTKCEIGKTSMLAVNLGASDARAIIASDTRFQQLAISCDNSRTDCVVGGPVPQLEAFKNHLKSTSGIKSKLLDVPLAYHTDAMDPILPELVEYANTVVLRKPSIPVVSNVLGHIVPAGEDVFTPEYFARHSRQTVAFQQGLDEYLADSPDAAMTHWVELGPHASLLPMISTQATTAQAGLVPCLRKGLSPSATLSQLLSHFYQRAAPIKWRKAFDFQEKPQLVDLPGLPFFQSEFVVSYPHETSALLTGLPEKVHETTSSNAFLSRTIQKASETNDFIGIYQTSIQSLREFITGHIVCEHALCPASVYHQMALSAVQDMQPEKGIESAWSLSDITYVAPLLYTSQSTAIVRIRVFPSSGSQNEFSFEVSSFADGTEPDRGITHCKGHLKCKVRKTTEKKYTRAARMLKRQVDRFIHPDPNTILETFSTKAMYENVFTRVVTYSKLYQQVQYIRISPECDEAYARCKSSVTPSNTPADSSAIFMDVLLHVAGFVANLSIGSGEACICKEVESALVLREPVSPGTMFDVHCTVIELPREGLFIADAQATDEHGVMASFKGMAFQRVQLAKINQAFGIQSRRGQGTSNAAPRPQQPNNTKKAVELQPAVSVPSSQSKFAVKNLIAQTCGADATDLSSEANLEAFGFDSLLMIELEAQLSSAYPQLDVSALAECHTIGDIENLCSGQQTIETPPNSVIGVPNEDVADVADDIPNIQRLTRAIIAETCSGDVDSIDSSSELSALGIDSLMIFELESSLSKISNGGYLSSSDLEECHTVGDVEKLILSSYPRSPTQDSSSAVSSSNSSSSTSPVSSSGATTPTATPTALATPITAESSQVLFNTATIEKVTKILNLDQQPEIVQAAPSSQLTGNDKREPSLFLIHDGSGVCTHYHRLQPLRRPVYALHDPKLLDPFDGWKSLSAMAEEYARQISATTAGPYLLGGWSFGGVVAFEAARQLLSQGHGVIGVILIDSPAPLDHQPLSARIIDAVTSQAKEPGTEAAKAIRAVTRRSFASCANLLGAFTPSPPSAQPVPRVFLLRSREGWQDASDPDFFENEWLQDRRSPRGAISGWETVTASKVAWVDIPGNHFQVFDAANIEATSTSIRRACAELEGAYSRV
ncbi:putative polyketide synthase [Annulohypoxylon maeteangense]|uniref:putative polyketide synthase n=1 Tax=Annulohypoxylon maeteangense TaxID=1927788 RepID=UPI002008EB8A|nr:putative polyketide synthase [Annulohypoxylon maeteangense]KAI0888173.1 putative polyketide synthase [Annulohypoxylon maeteangense]